MRVNEDGRAVVTNRVGRLRQPGVRDYGSRIPPRPRRLARRTFSEFGNDPATLLANNRILWPEGRDER